MTEQARHSAEQLQVERFRVVTAEILLTQPLRLHGTLVHQSLDPDAVDRNVHAESLIGECYNVSEIIQGRLEKKGIATKIAATPHLTYPQHWYLIEPQTDVVFDMAIGQLVIGHNHGFVDTRRKLRTLITQHTDRNPYRRLSEDVAAEDFFETYWGSTSQYYKK